jgi:hypothetical protein
MGESSSACSYSMDAAHVFRNEGSPSLPGIWAAVEAGLGITLRTAAGLPVSLLVLDDRSGLPSVPPMSCRCTMEDESWRQRQRGLRRFCWTPWPATWP